MLNSISKVNISFFNLFKVFLIVFLFFLIPVWQVSAAEEECEDAEVSVVARDFSGKFIPELSFEIHKQVDDVDGNPKPSEKVASGKIDEFLGRGTVTFDPEKEGVGAYAIRIYDFDNDYSFWYYDDLSVSCGSIIEVTEYLNGVEFLFQDDNANIKKDIRFYLYEQLFDDTGFPLQEKGELVDSFNAGADGEEVIYVPHSSYTLDGKGNNRYVLEAKNENSYIFTKYNIILEKDEIKEIVYTFSSMILYLKDEKNVPLLPKNKVKIYNQDSDREVLGSSIKTLYTDSNGIITFEYPEGTYAAQIEQGGKEVNFFNLNIVTETSKNYILKLDGTLESSKICASTDFTLIAKRLNSRYITDPLRFELYEVETGQLGKKIASTKVASGKIDESGYGKTDLKPDEYKTYALKIYDKNSDAGDYWYFDSIKFECGKDKIVTKYLPVLTIVLRNGDGDLVRNQKFSLYTQKLDADNKPVKEKEGLVYSSFSTNEVGEAEIYVAPSHPYNDQKKGTYVLVISGDDDDFVKYNINIPISADVNLEYILSDILASVKSGRGDFLSGENIDFYNQGQSPDGKNILGNKIDDYKIDDNGNLKIQYPAGIYALVIDDDIGQKNIFWDIIIRDGERTIKEIITNLTRIGIKASDGTLLPEGESIEIYSVKEVSPSYYQRDKKIKTVKTGDSKYAEISLAEGPYLFISSFDNLDYGKIFYVRNGLEQVVTINYRSSDRADGDKKFKMTETAAGEDSALLDKVKGRVLLQVEKNGEAWYIDIESKRRYYMKNGTAAYNMMRKFGLGITNENLDKIPIGLDDRFNEKDSDSDGVPDKMEEALGIDIYDDDSDNDGYIDGVEVRNNYNPKGREKRDIDTNLANKLKGKILLQVESLGQAWYINPDDGKRYYMKDGDSAYEIMRFLSLGITNANLYKIREGVID